MNIALSLFFWFRYLLWVSGIVLAIAYACGFRRTWLYPYFCLAIYLFGEDVLAFFIQWEHMGLRDALEAMIFFELPLTESKSRVVNQVHFSNTILTIIGFFIPIYLGIIFGAKRIKKKELYLSKIGLFFLLSSAFIFVVYQNIVGGGTTEKNQIIEFYTKVHTFLYQITLPIAFWLFILGVSTSVFYLKHKK